MRGSVGETLLVRGSVGREGECGGDMTGEGEYERHDW